MAVAFDSPPHDSLKALDSALAATQQSEFAFADVHLADSSEPSVQPSTLMPHQVYAIRLDELASQDRLDLDRLARPVSWRYILGAATAPVTSADVNVGPEEGRHKFSQLTKNGIPDSTVLQIKRSSSDQRFSGPEYRVRLLWVPALSFAALWLHRPDLPSSKDDTLVPLEGYSSVLNAGQYYTAVELLTHLQPRAQWKKSMLPAGAA